MGNTPRHRPSPFPGQPTPRGEQAGESPSVHQSQMTSFMLTFPKGRVTTHRCSQGSSQRAKEAEGVAFENLQALSDLPRASAGAAALPALHAYSHHFVTGSGSGSVYSGPRPTALPFPFVFGQKGEREGSLWCLLSSLLVERE